MDSGWRIARPRMRHKTVRHREKERLLMSPSTNSFWVLIRLPPAFPPLPLAPTSACASAWLMAGSGGLTCLLIDGNVSGSHFLGQRPAAFHHARARSMEVSPSHPRTITAEGLNSLLASSSRRTRYTVSVSLADLWEAQSSSDKKLRLLQWEWMM